MAAASLEYVVAVMTVLAAIVDAGSVPAPARTVMFTTPSASPFGVADEACVLDVLLEVVLEMLVEVLLEVLLEVLVEILLEVEGGIEVKGAVDTTVSSVVCSKPAEPSSRPVSSGAGGGRTCVR